MLELVYYINSSSILYEHHIVYLFLCFGGWYAFREYTILASYSILVFVCWWVLTLVIVSRPLGTALVGLGCLGRSRGLCVAREPGHSTLVVVVGLRHAQLVERFPIRVRYRLPMSTQVLPFLSRSMSINVHSFPSMSIRATSINVHSFPSMSIRAILSHSS